MECPIRLALSAVTGLWLFVGPPVAAKTHLGLGDVTCAAFLRDSAKDGAAARSFRIWISGFLSGINEYAPGPNLLRDGLDETYIDRVESACRSRPDQPLSATVIDVAMDLSKEITDSSDPRVEITAGSQVTFKIAPTSQEPRQRLQRLRRTPIGSTDSTALGEITIGLAPAGGACGCAKLHLFERTERAVRFTATAFRGREALASEKVCGRLEMDSWIALPAATTSVRIFDVSFAKQACS